jgi:hypothetical protein
MRWTAWCTGHREPDLLDGRGSYAAAGGSFHAEAPRLLQDSQFVPRIVGTSFDVHPDGERFALTKATGADISPKRTHITLIFNFLDELRKIAPQENGAFWRQPGATIRPNWR